MWVQRKVLNNKFYNGNENSTRTNKNWHCINFCKEVTNKVSSLSNKLGLNVIQVNKNNLGALLSNNKEKTKNSDKSGVYEIKCADCDAIYIGQSGRNISIRIKEHKMNIVNNKRATGFAEHCLNNGHLFNSNDVKILHNTNKGKRLDLLEILEIKKALLNNKHITNTQTEFLATPVVDKIVKLTNKVMQE